MSDIKIITGDCREILKTLPDKSINCCVTSPPYWRLRDYGVDGQLGLEDTPEEYVANMVGVFREVWRVLRDDGTFWLNMGDSYAAGKAGRTDNGTDSRTSTLGPNRNGLPNNSGAGNVVPRKAPDGLKPKDLVGIPWRIALALQADGWYLRCDIIWHKPNPMPESVKDRPTKAHEYIFLLSKSEKYYYDYEAIKESGSWNPLKTKMPDGWDTGPGSHGSFHRNGREKGRKTDKQRGHSRRHAGFNDRWDKMSVEEQCSMGRNKRSVWTIATKPYSEAHFATFPPKLIEPCILAGCPEGGTVLDPFGGSGTTGRVAAQHRRNAILIELNPEYVEMQEKRTSKVQVNLF